MRSRRALSLPNGATEHRFQGSFANDADLSLDIVLRLAHDSPVVRFQYVLNGARPRTMTKSSGKDAIEYLRLGLGGFSRFQEVRFSDFSDQSHSYTLNEISFDARHFDNEVPFFGPLIAAGGARGSVLVAYEHGSELPDAFLGFTAHADRSLSLAAVKGNYYAGQQLGSGSPFESVWFDVAAVDGDFDELAGAFRHFVLTAQSQDKESRKPYILFDTWNYQERDKWWNKRTYLASMNEKRVLAEIEVAARLGVEIFYLDAGWFDRTGDWRPALSRFPHGLNAVREALRKHGMHLGLWFDPTAAAFSSSLLARHKDHIATFDGKPKTREIWETEESYRMCLVSPFFDSATAELIRIMREHDAKYVLLDAVHQDECNGPGHAHGTGENSAAERGQSFAFQLVGRLTRMAEQVQKAVPGAIVDLDVTEKHRSFGLGYLAAGKFYLVNNGPYLQNLDMPLPPDTNIQPLFNNGQARGLFLRHPVALDRWLPTTLFSGMYFPEEPYRYQLVNAANLILGQGGVWGDLLSMKQEGIAAFGELMRYYKQVREDMTETSSTLTGMVSGSPEVYEKISPRTGRGAVVMFATEAGEYVYVAENPVQEPYWATPGATLTFDKARRAKITARFEQPGARIVYFGVQK